MKDKKLKSTKGLAVCELTFYFPDKKDNKIYEYTGDHSSFCDGIDPDPWAMVLPAIGHDLELSCDGQQLGRRCMANFYCEFFHQSNSTIYSLAK